MELQNDTLEILETDKIIFPAYFTHKIILEKHLLIAPNYPVWMVLNDSEYDMFLLLEKYSVGEAFFRYKKEKEESFCIEVRDNLLSKIFNNNFYESADYNEEENIESIQKAIHINVTNACNMSCKHCFVNAGRVPFVEISVKEILKLVDDITSINGYTSVTISGGECLIYKDIFVLLEGLKGHKISLFTNGILINENNIEKIATLVDDIQISMEGISKEIYEKNRGKGNYEKLLNAIDLIKKYRIKLNLAITILPDSLQDISENLIDFIKEINYDLLFVRLNNEIEMSGAALKELDLSNYDFNQSNVIMYNLFKRLKDELNINVNKLRTDKVRFKNCGIGTNIVIDSSGKIYPCAKFGQYFLDKESSAKDIINQFDALNKNTSIDFIQECKMCDLKYICSGGCKINHLIKNKSLIKTHCSNTFKQKMYEKLVYEEMSCE